MINVDDIQTLISKMTLDEKLAMIHANGLFKTGGISRLNIPALKMSDGPMGVRNEFANDEWRPLQLNDDAVTYMPCISALASTWDRHLAEASGKVLGAEARGRGKDIILGPGLNIKRTPLCGRNFEYFSEDPYLTAQLAAPFIRGVQTNDVAACPKHFALNNQETHRMDVDVQVDDQTRNDVYFKVFEETLKLAHPYALMGAYSRINGEFCCASPEIDRLLREEWGYDGVYLSDWGAVHDTEKTAQYGVDIEMSVTANFDAYYLAKPLKAAVLNGTIDEALIDAKVARILQLMKRIKCGETTRAAGAFNAPAHQQAAKQVAEASVVLLKNETKILPLSKAIKRVLVVGENAVTQHAGGGGSAEINALYEITPLMGIKMLLGGNTQVDYLPGYQSFRQLSADDAHPDAGDVNWQADSLNVTEIVDNGALTTAQHEIEAHLRQAAIAAAKDYDTVIFVGGLNHDFDVENQDRSGMDLPYEQDELIAGLLAVHPDTVITLVGGSPVTMSAIAPKAKALVWQYYAGMAGGTALAEVLFGEVTPSGHLAESFPLRYTDTAVARLGEFPGGESVRYHEGPFIGYKYYDATTQPVAFPFGHGLSYTTFAYHDFAFDEASSELTGIIINTGDYDGQTVIQVYGQTPCDYALDQAVPGGYKRLLAFEKYALPIGATLKITLPVSTEQVSELFVGTSIADVLMTQTLGGAQ